MSEEFKIEIVNPEQSFLSKEDVTEVIVPAYEGEMGILKDHISIISFLKPGIIKVNSKSGEEFTALDNKKYKLENGMCVISDNKGVLGLGGIIGGTRSGTEFHTKNISFLVIPLMIIEVVISIIICYFYFSILSLINLSLVALIWITTFLLQVPSHNKLSTGKSITEIEKLVSGNVFRVYLWFFKAIVSTLIIL